MKTKTTTANLVQWLISKRRRPGQQNPVGARTSGLRWRRRSRGGAHAVAGFSVADVVVYGRSHFLCGGRGRLRTEPTRESCGGMAGLALTSTGPRKAPHQTARCLMLEAVPWENPTYGILGRAAGNVAYGGTVLPRCNRKGGDGNPPPKGARASALPDMAKVVRVFGIGDPESGAIRRG